VFILVILINQKIKIGTKSIKQAVENVSSFIGANINDGDFVVITKGISKDDKGGTNTMKIVQAGSNNY
jgi:pyruvate kinase